MKKSFVVLFLISALVMLFSFTACGQTEESSASAPDPEASVEEEATVDGSAYGYAGDDPVEAAVYKYMSEEMSKNYGEADVHIPTVSIVRADLSNEEDMLVYGDFWVDNYNIDGDTLKCVSGGNYPGVMHVKKDGDTYEVTNFDVVEDGANFDPSAKELFGEYYDDFMKVYSDSDARDELRKVTVTEYVNLNGLDVKQFQDEGWDPVELYQK